MRGDVRGEGQGERERDEEIEMRTEIEMCRGELRELPLKRVLIIAPAEFGRAAGTVGIIAGLVRHGVASRGARHTGH